MGLCENQKIVKFTFCKLVRIYKTNEKLIHWQLHFSKTEVDYEKRFFFFFPFFLVCTKKRKNQENIGREDLMKANSFVFRLVKNYPPPKKKN